MTLIADIRLGLINAITDLTISNVFIDFCPASPADLVCITQYGSRDIMNKHVSQGKNIQVLARHSSSEIAISLINSIRNVLATENNYLLINSRHCYIDIISEPAFLKRENNLSYYTFNFFVHSNKD